LAQDVLVCRHLVADVLVQLLNPMSKLGNDAYSPVAVPVMEAEQVGACLPTAGELMMVNAPPLAVQKDPATTLLKQQPKAPEVLSNTFICDSLDKWQSQEADGCQALIVTRPIDPSKWQSAADRLAEIHGEHTLKKEIIELDASNGEDSLQQRIQDAANTISCDLEPTLAKLLCQDAQALAVATHKILPRAKQLIMKLELFGEDVCSRWHVDRYVCRSIVSYNCSALDYTADSNVDMIELYHGGSNEEIIRDESVVHSGNVGDMVMIKGLKYPGKGKGLVHKSPEIRYKHGNVMTRLILKVDVMELEQEAFERCCDEC